MEDKFASLIKRLEAVTTKLETMPAAPVAGVPPPAGGAPEFADEVLPPMITAFDDFLNDTVAAYVAAAGALNMPEVRARARPSCPRRELIFPWGLLRLFLCRLPSRRAL